MSLESQVADLITATTAMTSSVNTRMDEVVAIAKAKAVDGKTITNSTLDACPIGMNHTADGGFNKLISDQLITRIGRAGVYLTRSDNKGDYSEVAFGLNALNPSIGHGASIRSARVNIGSGGNDGDLSFHTSNGTGNGVADSPMVMRLDQAGSLLVGIASADCHFIQRAGSTVLMVNNTIDDSDTNNIATFTSNSKTACSITSAADGTFNQTRASMLVNKYGLTGRSINAAGTINASGADYAEYEYKSAQCGPVLAGQIIGFDADGLLTDQFNKAVSFAIKSTNPSIVGGDSWGDESIIGAKPKEPVAPDLPVLRLEPQSPVPDQFDGDLDAYHAAITTYHADHLLWLNEQTEHARLLSAANLKQDKVMQDYEAERAVWDVKLEAARASVDRIAYCGKVPVLLAGAKLGDYLLPVAKGPGISGRWVAAADIDLVPGDYRRAIGQVRKVLKDGTAIVVVKPI